MSNVAKMPKTTEVTFGGLTLRCRLDGNAILKIETRLDESLIGLFVKGEGEMKLPPSNKLLIVLQLSNTVHGIREIDVKNAFIRHIEEGGNSMDIFEKVQEVLDAAGFFPKQEAEEDERALDSTPTDEEVL